MKTLKILVVLILMLGFSFNYAKSQVVNKSEYPEFWANYGDFFPCVNETLSGWVTIHHWFMEGRHLVKADGTLIGDGTGKEYTLDTNWDYLEYVPSSGQAPFYKWVQTRRLRDGNKLVAIGHWTYHATIDENGVVIPIIEKGFCDCK